MNKNDYNLSKTIAGEIRSWIIKGKLKPQDKLTPRAELEQRFSTTPKTIQKSCDQLVQSGFLKVVPRRGTYIADYLPHKYNFAVLIKSKADSPGWTNYWSVIQKVCGEISKSSRFNFEVRTDVNVETRSESYLKLLDDVESQRLAGVVFAMNAKDFLGTATLESQQLQRFSLNHNNLNIPSLSLSMETFSRKALAKLKSLKAQKVAALMPMGFNDEQKDAVLLQAKNLGLEMDESMLQSLDIHHLSWVKNILSLMFAVEDKPDALIVFDDNFLPEVEGVLEGLKLIGKVQILSHANFPLLQKSNHSCLRLGYDVRDVFQQIINHINKQRLGAEVLAELVVEAKFEEELCAIEHSKNLEKVSQLVAIS
ncbi:GntR family transcriptional regulator [Lentisphaera profundi]|uniref:GntR family transcriptional regulator n=1 Tax=Lentisphaera profundi TaxID=1658616 RepID=A0ABY7VNF6_9BACT|nr:GntR family transcriptional regulator [Lentisphaera profundi]WDE95281.1 GntR family transcriptional regulator [Lentisphaera profundi]